MTTSINMPSLPALSSVSAKDWLFSRKDQLKGWRSFLDSSKFKYPPGVEVWSKRLVKNLETFQSNYLCVFLILTFYCILTSPLLLIALAFLIGSLYYATNRNKAKKLTFHGKEITLAYQYVAISLLTFPLFYVSGAGSAIFWIIGATFVMVFLHSTFYAIEAPPSEETFDLTMENI